MKKYLAKLGFSSPEEEQELATPLPKKVVSEGTKRLQKLRKKNKRVELYLTPEQWKWLSELAKAHNLKLSPFLKACVLAYQEKLFILPDRDVLHQLEVGMRKIGTNINQCAYVANRESNVSANTLDQLIHDVRRLEGLISKSLTYPDDLESLVKKALRERPTFVVILERILNQHYQDDY